MRTSGHDDLSKPLSARSYLANKKRILLDTTNKKRNTVDVLRGGLCLQFFPPRLGPLVSDAAAFDNPRQHSFLLAPMRQAQNQGPAIGKAVSTMPPTEMSPAMRKPQR